MSVPNDAASYPRDNALEVARSMEIAVIAWKAAHGNETLKHPDQSLLARSFLAVASELTWRDQLSAAPAPADQDEYYWWCAGCQREVPQEEVGLDNKHTLCPNKLNRWRRAAPSPGAQSGSPDASGTRWAD